MSREQNLFIFNLTKLLKFKGITQTELANYLDKTPTAISYYFNGKAFPPIEELNKIAKYFGVTIDNLINKKLKVEWDDE